MRLSKHEQEDEPIALKGLKPIAGKILFQLDRVNGIKKIGSIYLVDETSRASRARKATIVAIGVKTWRGRLINEGKHEFEVGSRVVIDMKAAHTIPTFEKFRIYGTWWDNVLGVLESEDDTSNVYGDLQ